MQILPLQPNKLKLIGLNLAVLFTSWIAGSFVGFLIYRSAGDLFSSLMRGATSCSVSIVGLLSVVFFPLLITALAVIYSKPILLHFLCFAKGVIYSACALSVYFTFGSAGWLLQILLMFSDNCTMVVLWILWLKYLWDPLAFSCRYILGVVPLCALALSLDVFFISPFVVSIMI